MTRVAQCAALVLLENDDFKNKSAKLNLQNKEKFFNRLEALNIETVASETNFLLFSPKVYNLC